MNKNLIKFEEDLILNGGSTYEIETGESPESGFIVNLQEFEVRILQGGSIQENIKTFVRVNAVELSKDGNYLGGWKDDGQYVLDVSKVFETKDEAFVFALQNEQSSFYDMSEGVLYRIDKHNRLYKQTPEGQIYESIPLT